MLSADVVSYQAKRGQLHFVPVHAPIVVGQKKVRYWHTTGSHCINLATVSCPSVVSSVIMCMTPVEAGLLIHESLNRSHTLGKFIYVKSHPLSEVTVTFDTHEKTVDTNSNYYAGSAFNGRSTQLFVSPHPNTHPTHRTHPHLVR